MTARPTVCVSQECSLRQSLAEDVALWQDLGVDLVGIISPKIEPSWDISSVTNAGLKVASIGAEMHSLGKALACAASVGAESVWTCTGPLGPRTWNEAADDFCQRIAPFVTRAEDLGVVLAIEPTIALRSDVSFIYTMRDTFDLARAAGVGVVLDFAMCWFERDLDGVVRSNMDILSLVQVNDFKLGSLTTPDRSVLGDGDIPLERLIKMLLEAGYSGIFDLEILGPKIDAEGYGSAIRRSLDKLDDIFQRVAA
jgi:sugar phosphate isomerase/epimerase